MALIPAQTIEQVQALVAALLTETCTVVRTVEDPRGYAPVEQGRATVACQVSLMAKTITRGDGVLITYQGTVKFLGDTLAFVGETPFRDQVRVGDVILIDDMAYRVANTGETRIGGTVVKRTAYLEQGHEAG